MFFRAYSFIIKYIYTYNHTLQNLALHDTGLLVHCHEKYVGIICK